MLAGRVDAKVDDHLHMLTLKKDFNPRASENIWTLPDGDFWKCWICWIRIHQSFWLCEASASLLAHWCQSKPTSRKQSNQPLWSQNAVIPSASSRVAPSALAHTLSNRRWYIKCVMGMGGGERNSVWSTLKCKCNEFEIPEALNWLQCSYPSKFIFVMQFSIKKLHKLNVFIRGMRAPECRY